MRSSYPPPSDRTTTYSSAIVTLNQSTKPISFHLACPEDTTPIGRFPKDHPSRGPPYGYYTRGDTQTFYPMQRNQFYDASHRQYPPQRGYPAQQCCEPGFTSLHSKTMCKPTQLPSTVSLQRKERPCDEETGPTSSSGLATFEWILRHLIRLDTQILLTLPAFGFLILLALPILCAYFVVRSLIEVHQWFTTPRIVKKAREEMLRATEWTEYKKVAERLDYLLGHDAWKRRHLTPLYDWQSVERRLWQLRECRASWDVVGLIENLTEGLDNYVHFSKMLLEDLYSLTYTGTKVLIEEYVKEVCFCLDFLTEYVEKPHHDEATESIQMLLHKLTSMWGSTGIFLSGGGSLGFHHIGVIDVLLTEGLLPNIFSGASAGAIISAWVCSRTDEEIKEEVNAINNLPFMAGCAPFDQDPYAQLRGTIWYSATALKPGSWIRRCSNFVQNGYACDAQHWEGVFADIWGTMTFEEAFHRTGRVLNISCTRADTEAHVVLNYKNAPTILLASAVLASTAFPGLGRPVHLKEKILLEDSIQGNPYSGTENCPAFAVRNSVSYDGLFHDGSLLGDVPEASLREQWGMQYTIVSQVNLHVFPFLGLDAHGEAGSPVALSPQQSLSKSRGKYWRGGFVLACCEVVLKEMLRCLLRVTALLDLSPTYRGVNAGNLALQSYNGDLTLHPQQLSWNYIYALGQIPSGLLKWMLQHGRQMIFPKMSLISHRMKVEKCIERLHLAAFQSLLLPSLPSSHHPSLSSLENDEDNEGDISLTNIQHEMLTTEHTPTSLVSCYPARDEKSNLQQPLGPSTESLFNTLPQRCIASLSSSLSASPFCEEMLNPDTPTLQGDITKAQKKEEDSKEDKKKDFISSSSTFSSSTTSMLTSTTTHSTHSLCSPSGEPRSNASSSHSDPLKSEAVHSNSFLSNVKERKRAYFVEGDQQRASATHLLCPDDSSPEYRRSRNRSKSVGQGPLEFSTHNTPSTASFSLDTMHLTSTRGGITVAPPLSTKKVYLPTNIRRSRSPESLNSPMSNSTVAGSSLSSLTPSIASGCSPKPSCTRGSHIQLPSTRRQKSTTPQSQKIGKEKHPQRSTRGGARSGEHLGQDNLISSPLHYTGHSASLSVTPSFADSSPLSQLKCPPSSPVALLSRHRAVSGRLETRTAEYLARLAAVAGASYRSSMRRNSTGGCPPSGRCGRHSPEQREI